MTATAWWWVAAWRASAPRRSCAGRASGDPCVVTSDLSPPAFISSVRLLEAAPRLGGRAYTRTHGEAVLELGAQWLHGACAANPVFNLAARHGLLGPR